MISGPLLFGDEPVPPAEFTRMVGIYASAERQQNALKRWLDDQPELSPDDRSWVEQLPNEKLRQRANELLDEKAAKAK